MVKLFIGHGFYTHSNQIKFSVFAASFFGSTASLFCSGMNTWEEISKKLKDHENSTFHKKCFSQWMLLKEGI